MLNKVEKEEHNHINNLRVRSFRTHKDIEFKPKAICICFPTKNKYKKSKKLMNIFIKSVFVNDINLVSLGRRLKK